MICVKCKKEIPDGSLYCNFCGKKQEVSKRKTKRRARGSGSISRDSRNSQKPYIARAVPLQIGGHGAYIGSFSTIKEAQAAIEQYEAKQKPDLYNATVKQIYEKWSEKHFETLTADGQSGYRAAFKNIEPLHKRNWYWHKGEYTRRGKRRYDMDEIRAMHGSEKIRGNATKRITA